MCCFSLSAWPQVHPPVFWYFGGGSPDPRVGSCSSLCLSPRPFGAALQCPDRGLESPSPPEHQTGTPGTRVASPHHPVPTGKQQAVVRRWLSEAGLPAQQQQKSDFFIASIRQLFFFWLLVLKEAFQHCQWCIAGSSVSCKLGGLQITRNQR